MSKIKFNKMNKSLSIQQGKRLIGIIDIEEFKRFMKSNDIVGAFKQFGENKKQVIISKLVFNKMRIAVGKAKPVYIKLDDFIEYFNNKVLDIKEFEQLKAVG